MIRGRTTPRVRRVFLLELTEDDARSISRSIQDKLRWEADRARHPELAALLVTLESLLNNYETIDGEAPEDV